jgi:hypothetical protein
VDAHLTGLFDDLQAFIESFGVRVVLKEMDIETPGTFDGLTVTINPKHNHEAACFYLAHSFGSIVQWSTDFARARKTYDDLRSAESHRDRDPGAFEIALARYRTFEETSSEHAVWMLERIDHANAVGPYSIFFRADLEAMTIFHRTGKAPRWPDFFAEWKRKIASGELHVEPFSPRPFGPFRPVRIEQQQVLQERD